MKQISTEMTINSARKLALAQTVKDKTYNISSFNLSPSQSKKVGKDFKTPMLITQNKDSSCHLKSS
jgi:hypothetical protein